MTAPAAGARRSYRARWIVPVDREPIEQGTIEIEGGRITAVHDRTDKRSRDLGNVAILPGLVNAHTHLEFSALGKPISPVVPFPDWIRAVRDNRAQRTDDDSTSVTTGLVESAAAGTTTVGEIATAGWSPDPFTPAAPRAVVFRELIGLRSRQIDQQLAIARDHLTAGDQTAFASRTSARKAPHPYRGLSPHAPYSVHRELYSRLVALAAEFRVPMAVHLAETREELELLAHRRGGFVEMLKDFGVWEPDAIPRRSRPLDYLQPLTTLEHALVVHGNYLSAEEIEFVCRHPNLTVIYCPRTHARFGHRGHPWRRLLEGGGRVAIGTDSRASNPDLSLWRELCFLREQFSDVPPRKLLELGTVCGARALGLEETAGTLTVGRSADLTVISLDAAGTGDIAAALLHPRHRVVATMRSGLWITRQTIDPSCSQTAQPATD